MAKPSYQFLNLNIYFDNRIRFKSSMPVKDDPDGVRMSIATWRSIFDGGMGKNSPWVTRIKS
jgi:hypothetical protein